MSIFVWRLWGHRGEAAYNYGNVLCGLYSQSWYPGKIMQAKCNEKSLRTSETALSTFGYRINLEVIPRHYEDDVPHETCRCGIYGLKPDSLPTLFDPNLYILGVAEVWGKIITAEHGYRAQFAKIRALINAPSFALDYDVLDLPSIDYAHREFFS